MTYKITDTNKLNWAAYKNFKTLEDAQTLANNLGNTYSVELASPEYQIPELTPEQKLQNDIQFGNQLIDIIIPENQILTDDYIINNEEITLLNGVLLKLEPRERDVIMMSFGINYPYEMTLDEIGERLNISRERVRTIKQKVMRKLRLKLEKFN